VPGTIYATLQDLSNMRVDFSVPEQQIEALALGGPVTVATEVGNFSATGRIIAIEPRVDASSRMILVRAEVENPSGDLYPGQFLRVRIALPQEEGVIAVPQTAVSSTLYGDSIYVVKPGETEDELKAEQVFVTVGRRSGGRIAVVEGLAAGDHIVTSGQTRRTSGARVKIDNSVTIGDVTDDSAVETAPATAPPEAPPEEAPAPDGDAPDAAAPGGAAKE